MKLRKGDRFIFRGIEYEVLDILVANDYYYKVRGSCGAIKIYPVSIENREDFIPLL